MVETAAKRADSENLRMLVLFVEPYFLAETRFEKRWSSLTTG